MLQPGKNIFNIHTAMAIEIQRTCTYKITVPALNSSSVHEIITCINPFHVSTAVHIKTHLEIINISGLDITIIKSKQVTKELSPHAAISIIKCIS